MNGQETQISHSILQLLPGMTLSGASTISALIGLNPERLSNSHVPVFTVFLHDLAK